MQFVSILTQMNPLHDIPSCCCKINFNVTLPSAPRISTLPPLRFSTVTLNAFLFNMPYSFYPVWFGHVKEYEAFHYATFSTLLLHTPALSGTKSLPKHLGLSHNATQKFHRVQSTSKMTVLYVCFKFYVSRQQTGRQIFLNWMVTGIPKIFSTLSLWVLRFSQ